MKKVSPKHRLLINILKISLSFFFIISFRISAEVKEFSGDPAFKTKPEKQLELTDEERKWISTGYNRAFDYSMIWKGAVVTVIILMLIIFWNRRLAHEVAKRTRALELNKRIVSNSSIGKVVFNSSGKCIMANEAAATLIGGTVEDILEKDFRKIKDWSENGFMDLAEKALESEKEQMGDLAPATIFGKTVFLHCRFLPFRFEREQHLLLMFEDVSERKKAEEALKENELKYRTLFNSASDAIFILEGDHFVDCNLRALEMFGCEREDIIAKSPVNFSPERQPDGTNSTEKVKHLILQLLEGKPLFFEWKHKKKDGTLFDAEVTLNTIEIGEEKRLQAIVRDITKRKQSEEILRKERKFNETLIQESPAFFVAMNADGKILMMSKSMLEATEYSKDEVLGTDYIETFVPEYDHEKLLSVFEQLKAGVLTRSINENCILAKNGQELLVEWHGMPIFKETGELDFFFSVGTDITKRKRVEEALKRSEEKYRLIAENATDVIFTLDNDLNYTYISPSVERQRGYTPDELIKHGAVEFIPLSSRKIIRKALEEEYAIEKEVSNGIPRPRKLELEVYTKNGNLLWVEAVVSFIYDQNNNPIGVMGTTRDITDRKKAEEELRKSEEKFSKAFHASPDSISISMLESGLLSEINSGFEKTFGFKRDEALNRTSVELGIWVDPEDRIKMTSELKEKGMVRERQLDFHTKSGDTITCLLSGELITINNQEQAFIVIRDVSEHKRAEQERESLKNQLLQTQKMESLGVLAGGIAHDFNNILSSIFGYTELAKMSIDMGEDVGTNLEQVLNAATRAKNLVKHILTFSRQADIQKNPTAVRPLIKETLKFIRSSIPSTIEIHHDLGDNDNNLLALADPTQIHQIIMNLCTNAAHAMRDKGGTLDVCLKKVEITDETTVQLKEIKKGKYLQLTVADTGTGIKDTVIDHIFDPFYTTKERGEGTGLGLSVIHGIVKDMGGAISVYSEIDKGTTFQILLPEFEGETADNIPEQQFTLKGEGRILFVDDEHAIIESGKGILKSLGFDVISTNSSIDALELFKSQPDRFDLVLTDMTMPKMTGLELSKKLMEIREDIPIILCTGYSLGLSESKIRKNGIRKMIMKPIIRNELAVAIDGILSGKNK